MSESMRVVHVAAEHQALAVTGGLGQVVAGLSAVQAARGAKVTVIMPGYAHALERAPDAARVGPIALSLPWGPTEVTVWRCERAGVTVDLLAEPALFGRPELYGADGGAYSDNAVRFSVFARAALALVADADVVHLHDWHAGLLAPLIRRGRQGDRRPGVVFTVHNLAFQGAFPASGLSVTGLGPEMLSIDGVLHHGRINPLKAGLQHADLITTVSPTYAEELQTEAMGWDLAGLFRHRSADLVGIVNGLPPRSTPSPTTPRDQRRAALCHELELASPTGPLFGMVTRLTRQKGIDLLIEALPQALDHGGAACVILGTGEEAIAAPLRRLAAADGRVRFVEAYEPALAERIFDGVDVLCVPSRFEPCGLAQLHAMRAGALPLVRRTGGLADTVRDVDSGGADEPGWGFVFDQPTAQELGACLVRAAMLFRDDPRAWSAARSRAQACATGWEASAPAYDAVYARAVATARA